MKKATAKEIIHRITGEHRPKAHNRKQVEQVAPGMYDHSKHGRQLGGARHDGERKEKDNSRIEYARSLHLPTRTVLIQF